MTQLSIRVLFVCVLMILVSQDTRGQQVASGLDKSQVPAKSIDQVGIRTVSDGRSGYWSSSQNLEAQRLATPSTSDDRINATATVKRVRWKPTVSFFGVDQDLEIDEPVREREPTLSRWPRTAMTEIRIDPRDHHAELPPDDSNRLIQRFQRDWFDAGQYRQVVCWDAANICFQPLYFEDVGLERYGQMRNEILQSWLSAAHFFSSAALLPLHMRVDPIYGCDYPLGYCRPGNCTNRIFQRPFWGLNP